MFDIPPFSVLFSVAINSTTDLQCFSGVYGK